MRARQHLHTRQAIAKAVEGANRIYLTAHGHIAIVGQAALRSRAPARHKLCAHSDASIKTGLCEPGLCEPGSLASARTSPGAGG